MPNLSQNEQSEPTFEQDLQSAKMRKEHKKDKRRKWLTLIGLIFALFIGSFFGRYIDQAMVAVQNKIQDMRYADGLIYEPLDAEFYGETGKQENKAVVVYFDTKLHLDNLYVGKQLKTTIEVGNGAMYDTRLLFETDGPVKVEIDEEKAGGSEVYIPSHKKTKIPIIVTAPDEVFNEPVLTYVNVNQEPKDKVNQTSAQQLLPGANIPIFIPNIAPPMKPLILLSEAEFNALTKEQRALYDIEPSLTYDQLILNLSAFAKPIAYVTYQYDILMYETSGYFNAIALIILAIFMVAATYYFYRKRGRRKGQMVNEKTIQTI